MFVGFVAGPTYTWIEGPTYTRKEGQICTWEEVSHHKCMASVLLVFHYFGGCLIINAGL